MSRISTLAGPRIGVAPRHHGGRISSPMIRRPRPRGRHRNGRSRIRSRVVRGRGRPAPMHASALSLRRSRPRAGPALERIERNARLGGHPRGTIECRGALAASPRCRPRGGIMRDFVEHGPTVREARGASRRRRACRPGAAIGCRIGPSLQHRRLSASPPGASGRSRPERPLAHRRPGSRAEGECAPSGMGAHAARSVAGSTCPGRPRYICRPLARAGNGTRAPRRIASTIA